MTDRVISIKPFWDFDVYVKAQVQFFEHGSPYFEQAKFRYIYPPSANFLFYFFSDSAWFRTFFYCLSGMAWISIIAFFARKPFDLIYILPVFLLAFGKVGWATILTGNVACLLYFFASFATWAYFYKRISTPVFFVCIMALVIVKPFYAAFLVFIWFRHNLGGFIGTSIIAVALFFTINLTLYPELFTQFLEVLKFDQFDTQIFGFTAMSHFKSLGIATPVAGLGHLVIIGSMFLLFIWKYPALNTAQRFAAIFILACFLNPKQLTYDLAVALPALVILLLHTRMLALVLGSLILFGGTYFNTGITGTLYFQWWYGFVAVYLLTLGMIKVPFNISAIFKRILKPEHENLIVQDDKTPVQA